MAVMAALAATQPTSFDKALGAWENLAAQAASHR
jgi:hypothetical protein